MPVRSLSPPPNSDGEVVYLSGAELERLLRAKFDVVELDKTSGQQEAQSILSKLKDLNAPKSSIETLQAYQADSFRVFAADRGDEENALSFLFIPESDLTIVYSRGQGRYCRRCASALGYGMEVIN